MADRGKVFWGVLLVSVAAVLLAVWLPGGPPPKPPRDLPWQIEPLPDGTSRVFGIVLGRDSLEKLEQQLQEPAEVSLFASEGGASSLEAYFNSVAPGGIKSRMVAVLGASPAVLRQMFDRGARIATLAQGQRKVTLSGLDLARARSLPVVALTFLPRTDLEPDTLRRLFGPPGRTLPEPSGRMVHWLYPELGLDIAVDPEAREVFQYVPPRDFHKLLAPLEEADGDVDR